MDDFTKEELEFFFQFMIQCGSRGNLSKYNDVLVKLKSMIDNYCENDSIGQSDLPMAGADE